MPTNEERKRVADALMFLTLRPSLGERGEHADLCRACGCEGATWRDLFLCLADLIDPGKGQNGPDASTGAGRGTRVDRGALMALADKLSMEGMDGYFMPPSEYARRIREACGEAV